MYYSKYSTYTSSRKRSAQCRQYMYLSNFFAKQILEINERYMLNIYIIRRQSHFNLMSACFQRLVRLRGTRNKHKYISHKFLVKSYTYTSYVYVNTLTRALSYGVLTLFYQHLICIGIITKSCYVSVHKALYEKKR